jgi:hypothetical protein
MAVKEMRAHSQPIAIVVAVILVVMSGLAGCETVSEHKETAIGAGAGAAGGAVIGGLAGGTKGAVIGGLLGALAGGAVGNYLERKERDRPAAASAAGYDPSQGNVVRVERVQASPASVRPGGQVTLDVTYTILTPRNQMSTVRETREVRHDGQLVADPAIEVQRNDGTFTSTLPITLPSTARPGTYEVTTSVSMADRTSRSMTTFTVQ